MALLFPPLLTDLGYNIMFHQGKPVSNHIMHDTVTDAP